MRRLAIFLLVAGACTLARPVDACAAVRPLGTSEGCVAVTGFGTAKGDLAVVVAGCASKGNEEAVALTVYGCDGLVNKLEPA